MKTDNLTEVPLDIYLNDMHFMLGAARVYYETLTGASIEGSV